MPLQNKLEDAVTGQLLANDHACPDVSEGVELVRTPQRVTRRPNKARRNVRPKLDSQSRNRRNGLDDGVSDLFDRENLKSEIPEGAGTHICLNVIAEGGFSLTVIGTDFSATPMARVCAEPHSNVVGNGEMLPKGVSLATGEERRNGIGMIYDNRRLKRKKGN